MDNNVAISRETARFLLDAWEFFDKNPGAKEFEKIPGLSRSEFYFLVSSITGEDDLKTARNYLEGVAQGQIEGTLPQKLLDDVKDGKVSEAKIINTQKNISEVEAWIGKLRSYQKTKQPSEVITPTPAPIRTTTISAPPAPSPTTQGFSIVVEKAKEKTTAPLSLQTAIRRASFAPFRFLVNTSAPVIADKDPQGATALSLVAKGITPGKLAPLKQQALAAGISPSQFDKLVASMSNLPTGSLTRAMTGYANWSDFADFIYSGTDFSISPTQTGQVFLSSSGGDLAMPHYSFVGGIFQQIGTRLLGRATTSILGDLLGGTAGRAVGAGAGTAVTGAAAASAGAAGGAASGVAAGAAAGSVVPGVGTAIGAAIGAVGGSLASRAIVYFQRNKEKLIGFLLLGMGGVAAALGFGLGGLILMGAGGLALLGSAAGGMSGAGAQVGTFGGSVLYGITHVVVPSIAAPFVISFLSIVFFVAFVFFIINNSAFVSPGSNSANIGGNITPPGIIPGGCKVSASGLCSLDNPLTNLQSTFGSQASNAAQICLAESGGAEFVINDGCLANPQYNRRVHTADYSVGLFQINMLSHPNAGFLNTPAGQSLKDVLARHGGKLCYQAFSNYKEINAGNYSLYCDVADQSLLDDCVSWFQDPANNVAYANFASKGGSNWGPWSTARSCGIVK